jgi:hypothetical protein
MHQVSKDFSKEAVANTDYLSAVFNLFCQGLTAKQMFDSLDKIKYDNTKMLRSCIQQPRHLRIQSKGWHIWIGKDLQLEVREHPYAWYLPANDRVVFCILIVNSLIPCIFEGGEEKGKETGPKLCLLR